MDATEDDVDYILIVCMIMWMMRLMLGIMIAMMMMMSTRLTPLTSRYNREEVVASLGREINLNPPLTLGKSIN